MPRPRSGCSPRPQSPLAEGATRFANAAGRFRFLVTSGLLVDELRSHLRNRIGRRTDARLPTVPLRHVVGAATLPPPPESPAVPGNVSDPEIASIAALVEHFRPQVLFEFGTFDGRTTAVLAAHAPEAARVYTLDLPRALRHRTRLRIRDGDRRYIDKAQPGLRFAGTALAAKITQLHGDSATFDFSQYAGQVDFVFVDGAHSYDYVMNDTEVALRLLRNGRGVIVWHDYGLHEVARARDGRCRNMRAIDGTTLVVLVR